ncbi:hypothetical protein KBC80_00335 [Candidatus Woesebacteria bacterium]|nr:hypothetical protein [Candidatus Woesebacteria bacterium]
MKQNTLLTLLIVAVAMASGGFFAGMKYQQSKGAAFRTFGAQMGRQNNGNNRGFRPTAGQIVSIDATSMTVKLADGSTKIVLLNDKTQINKASNGALTDLVEDTQVAVFGTENSDGSVTAQSIQLNPQTMRMMGTTPTQSTKAAEAK